MRVPVLIVVLLGAVGFAGCTGETSTPPWRVVAALRQIGNSQLRRDAQTVAARVTVFEQFGPTKIPETVWTESIRKFRPVHVFWGDDHITIVTRESGRYRNGIRVYFPSRPDDSLLPGAFAGGGSGGQIYKVEAGVYWFYQKMRSHAGLRRKLNEMETNQPNSP